MSAEIITDEAIKLDQLEFNRECIITVGTRLCGHQAAWLGICRHCDDVVPTCDTHYAKLVALSQQAFPPIFVCRACRHDAVKLQDLVVFVPIGGDQ